MKIVNLDEFLTFPENTLFSKYEPCVFGDLSIKGKSLEQSRDFLYQQISDALDCENSSNFSAMLFMAEETGASVAMNFDCMSRDGLFEETQWFAVWEPEDLRGLINRLMACLPKDEA